MPRPRRSSSLARTRSATLSPIGSCSSPRTCSRTTLTRPTAWCARTCRTFRSAAARARSPPELVVRAAPALDGGATAWTSSGGCWTTCRRRSLPTAWPCSRSGRTRVTRSSARSRPAAPVGSARWHPTSRSDPGWPASSGPAAVTRPDPAMAGPTIIGTTRGEEPAPGRPPAVRLPDQPHCSRHRRHARGPRLPAVGPDSVGDRRGGPARRPRVARDRPDGPARRRCTRTCSAWSSRSSATRVPPSGPCLPAGSRWTRLRRRSAAGSVGCCITRPCAADVAREAIRWCLANGLDPHVNTLERIVVLAGRSRVRGLLGLPGAATRSWSRDLAHGSIRRR